MGVGVESGQRRHTRTWTTGTCGGINYRGTFGSGPRLDRNYTWDGLVMGVWVNVLF